MGLDCLVPFPFFGGDFHGLLVKLLLSASAPPAPPTPHHSFSLEALHM